MLGRAVRLIWFLIVVQDIVHDLDMQSEDWYIAVEALFEVIFSFIFCLFLMFIVVVDVIFFFYHSLPNNVVYVPSSDLL